MIIKVDKSKTGQLRQGDEVAIAQSEGNVCPVFLLKEYLKKLDISPDSNEFIFRPLVKTKSSYKLVKVDKHISYATFRGQLTKSQVFCFVQFFPREQISVLNIVPPP